MSGDTGLIGGDESQGREKDVAAKVREYLFLAMASGAVQRTGNCCGSDGEKTCSKQGSDGNWGVDGGGGRQKKQDGGGNLVFDEAGEPKVADLAHAVLPNLSSVRTR